jgi:methyl-accepting chemotaxis protein
MTTLACYIFIYHEVNTILNFHTWTSGLSPHATQMPSITIIGGSRIRILFLLSVGLFAIFLMSIIWLRATMRQINRPIHAIQHAIDRLAQGKLNETVMIESGDEVGQIGSGLNELAANLQELLLYVWKQTGQSMTLLDQMKHKLDLPDQNGSSAAEQREKMEQVVKSIESLREMAKAYVFYDVCLDGDKAIAIEQPGSKSTISSPSA